jgi:Flp pilus assembly protein TadD
VGESVISRRAPRDIAGLLLVTLFAFVPVLGNDFVNWDDPTVLVHNDQLGGPHAIRWALTTTLIGHYQPLAWIVWSGTKTLFGLKAAVFHGLGLVGHLLNTALVYIVVWRLVSLADLGGPAKAGRDVRGAKAEQNARGAKAEHDVRGWTGLRRRRLAALTAATVFAVHPVRVEAVAWASAFPYVMSLGGLLLAFLAYLNAHDRGAEAPAARASRVSLRAAQRDWAELERREQSTTRRGPSRRLIWLALSVVSYAAALLARATAIGFPLVLLAVDMYPLRRSVRRSLLLEKLPFVVVSLAAAVAELSAREVASLLEVGAGARLTMAATAPFIYLRRTFVPVGLSPLDPLPISPALEWVPLGLGVAGLAAVAVAVWRTRRHWPALAVAVIAYLLLLAPVAGLTPSGLQVTADRYMYVPGVVVALIVGVAAARLWPFGRMAIASCLLGAALVTALATATWRQAGWWHDSITLWTRTADLDPHNDIATYNLAVALAEAGRDDEAMARYEQTLRLVSDQTLAREHLTVLQAKQAEREANRFAAAGRLDEAEAQYARALGLDPKRTHARAARGIALMRHGRFNEAAAELRIAFDADIDDAEVPNSLAFALGQTGRSAEAVAVLERAVSRHPEDINLAHNLARLLATAPDPRVRNGATALRLAQEVRDRTGGRDPRALDTLAAAYAAVGRFEEARDTARQAAARARELGNADLAVEIGTHARSYAR